MKSKNICKVAAIMLLASAFPLGMNTARADEGQPSGQEESKKTLDEYKEDLAKAEAEKAEISEKITKIDEEISEKERALNPETSKEELDKKIEDLKQVEEKTSQEKAKAEEELKDLKDNSETPDISNLFPTQEDYDAQKEKFDKRDAEIDKYLEENIGYRKEKDKKEVELNVLKYEKEKREANLSNLSEEEKNKENIVIANVNEKIEKLNKELEQLKIDATIDKSKTINDEFQDLKTIEYELEVKKEYEAGDLTAENIDAKIAENKTLRKDYENNTKAAEEELEIILGKIRENNRKSGEITDKMTNNTAIMSWIDINRYKDDDLYFSKNKTQIEKIYQDLKTENNTLEKDSDKLLSEVRELRIKENECLEKHKLTIYNEIENDVKTRKYEDLKQFLSNPTGLKDKLIKEKESLIEQKTAELEGIKEKISKAEEEKANLKELTEDEKKAIEEEIGQAKTKRNEYIEKLDTLYKQIEDLKEIIRDLEIRNEKPDDITDNNYLGYYNNYFYFLNQDDEKEAEKKAEEKAKKKEEAKQALTRSVSRLKIAYNKGLTVADKAEIFLAKNNNIPKEKRERLQILINRHRELMKKLSVLIVRLEGRLTEI